MPDNKKKGGSKGGNKPKGGGGGGNAGGSGTPSIDERDLAARYGWAISVLKSHPSLWKVFQRAVKETWEPARFIAEVRETEWFQKHSESVRNYHLLKADPGTLRDRRNETRAQVRDIAVQMGAQLNEATLNRIAENVIKFGFNESQLRDTLAGAVKAGVKGTYGGQAAVNAETLKQVALNNGINIGDKQLRAWLVRIAAGEDIAGFEAYVRNMAMQAYPGFEKELKAGMNVRDLADPYIQQMADTLELNAEDLTLFDPTIRQALQSQTEDGQIAMKPLWKFEKELRKDPRWMKTNNARTDIMGKTRNVLQEFGVAF